MKRIRSGMSFSLYLTGIPAANSMRLLLVTLMNPRPAASKSL
jgi:hypothetical protein